MRSICGPSRRTMLDLSIPADRTRSTLGNPSSAAITAAGSSTAARRSRSPIVARRRRREPAGSMRTTPGTRSSCSMSKAASRSASWSSRRPLPWPRRAMPCRMLCSVRSEMPFTPRSAPVSAAARSAATESMPSSVWSSRTVRGPTPGTARISSRLAGTWSRSRWW